MMEDTIIPAEPGCLRLRAWFDEEDGGILREPDGSPSVERQPIVAWAVCEERSVLVTRAVTSGDNCDADDQIWWGDCYLMPSGEVFAEDKNWPSYDAWLADIIAFAPRRLALEKERDQRKRKKSA